MVFKLFKFFSILIASYAKPIRIIENFKKKIYVFERVLVKCKNKFPLRSNLPVFFVEFLISSIFQIESNGHNNKDGDDDGLQQLSAKLWDILQPKPPPLEQSAAEQLPEPAEPIPSSTTTAMMEVKLNMEKSI